MAALIKKNKKTYSIFLTVLLLLVLYFATQRIPEENVRTLLSRVGVFAPLVFILLVLVTHVIPPISSAPLAFAGFYVYGQMVVFLITLAVFFSYIINFWIARKWGRPLVKKFVGTENMGKIDQLTQNYGLFALIILRIFMGSIHDFISYAVGLTSFRFSNYLLVSSLALVPGTILWYYLALKVQTPLAFTILNFALGLGFSAVFIFTTWFFRKMRLKT